MSYVIHKYRLQLGENLLQVPRGTRFLTAQIQGGELQLWVLKPIYSNIGIERKVLVKGTGHEFEATDIQYISTVQDMHGLVWHILEVYSA